MGVNLKQEPRTADGRMMLQPVTLDEGVWHLFCGAGDSDGINGVIGAGTALLPHVALRAMTSSNGIFEIASNSSEVWAIK